MLIKYRLTRPARDKPEVVYAVIKEHKHMQIFELFSSVYTPPRQCEYVEMEEVCEITNCANLGTVTLS